MTQKKTRSNPNLRKKKRKTSSSPFSPSRENVGTRADLSGLASARLSQAEDLVVRTAISDEKPTNWEQVFAVLRREAAAHPSPSLNVVSESGSSPWQILAATILSLRTRDDVTLAASRRLFALAPDLAALRAATPEAIEAAIFPSAFYKTKTRQLQEIAALLGPLGDEVPHTREKLLELPGVGRKTANLVLNLAFGVEAICVDTHVHRIPNRLGWINTPHPEASEAALEALWPRNHWIEANALLVCFGQSICTPVSPRCSSCPFHEHCVRKGVAKSR